jgi:hypothetical protein
VIRIWRLVGWGRRILGIGSPYVEDDPINQIDVSGLDSCRVDAHRGYFAVGLMRLFNVSRIFNFPVAPAQVLSGEFELTMGIIRN